MQHWNTNNSLRCREQAELILRLMPCTPLSPLGSCGDSSNCIVNSASSWWYLSWGQIGSSLQEGVCSQNRFNSPTAMRRRAAEDNYISYRTDLVLNPTTPRKLMVQRAIPRLQLRRQAWVRRQTLVNSIDYFSSLYGSTNAS